jgi:hypothetical protein
VLLLVRSVASWVMRGLGIVVTLWLMCRRWWRARWLCWVLWVPSLRRVFRRLLIRGVILLRDVLTTVGELLGCVLVVVGVGFLSVPVALIVAGLLMVGLSWLGAR